MSISAISGSNAQTHYACRSPSGGPSSQTQALPAPQQTASKLPQIIWGSNGDVADVPAPIPNTSTLAGVQAAYASN